jgi:SOS-response transcriptional repressor LexA
MRRNEDGKFSLTLRPEELLSKAVCEIEWLDVPKNEDLAEDWESEPLFVPQFMLGYQDETRVRAFRVANDAMLDEHIREGDVVLIEKRAYARDGDIVVAVIPNRGAVLKQYFRDGAKVELRPANPKFETIVLSADKVEVCGTLHSVLRPAR